MRKRRTNKQRLALFEAAGGICHLCGMKIQLGEAWDLEHVIALSCGGTDDDENIKPAHRECHREKTRDDRTVGAKGERIRQKHQGAWRPRTVMPGSKASMWRRKMNGEVERR